MYGYQFNVHDVSFIRISIINNTRSGKKMIQNDVTNTDNQNMAQPQNDKATKRTQKPKIINYCVREDYPKPDDATDQVTQKQGTDENVCEVDDDCQEDEECVDGKCGRFLNC